MASTVMAAENRLDWPFSNPWVWMLTGLTSCTLALLCSWLAGEEAILGTWLLILLGVFTAAAALMLRLNSPQPAYLSRLSPRGRATAALGLAVGGAALVLTPLLLSVFRDAGADFPWSSAALQYVFWLVLVVLACAAFYGIRLLQEGQAVDAKLESAALLILAALCAFLCSWSLYFGAAQEKSWDTIRLLFAVFALAAFLAAPLVLLPTVARRLVISLLIVLHFVGILNAIMNAPPTPWWSQQLWSRFYRPYLQFIFLNNAYHFYAPEPGPSSYIWFRLEYELPPDENGKSQLAWWWESVPKVKDNGSPDYPTALQYQRRLAMTDQASQMDTNSIPLLMPDKQGRPTFNPYFNWRSIYSDNPPARMLGQEALGQFHKIPHIPFHPHVSPVTNQYQKPSFYSKKLLASFARHMAQKPHPKHPDARIKSIKVYRVVHTIPSPDLLANWRGPMHLKQLPTLYSPYYQGQFDPQGRLLDEPRFDLSGNLESGDPLLYWLIPILPDNPADPSLGPIRAWVYKHAGDEDWIIYPGSVVPEPAHENDNAWKMGNK